MNLTSTAESLLVFNAFTRGVFGTSATDFVGLTKNFGDGTNNSHEITAPEILNFLMGGSGGVNTKTFAGGMGDALKHNIRMNAPMMLAQFIAIPIAFKFGKKMLSKPVIRPANRMLKAAGVSGSVKV